MSKEQYIFMRFGRNVPKGSIIFKEGDTGEIMFLIRKGKVRIYKTFPGKEKGSRVEKELAILGNGDFFGEMSLFNNELRSASAIAIEDTKLLEINNQIFEQLVKSNGNFALKIIVKLSERIRNTSNMIKDIFIQRKQPQFISAISSILANNSPISFDSLFIRLKEIESVDLIINKEELKQLIDSLIKLGALSMSDEKITYINDGRLSDILALIS